MIIRNQLALLATAFVCILALGACGANVPGLRSVSISPTSETVKVSTTQQFTASAQYSDGSVKDATSLVTWSSSNIAVATIAVGGMAKALAPGTTTITATITGAPAATATLNVQQLQSIAVTPSNQNVPNGKTQQFSATGTYKNPDGTTVTADVTSQATWTSGTTTVASITSTGLATAVGIGTSLITAALDGVTGSTSMIVGAPVAVSLQVSPPNPTVATATTQQFTASARYSDGSVKDATSLVTWSSSNTAVATIAVGGVAKALALGTTTITATITGAPAATATLNVQQLQSIAVTPSNQKIPNGKTQQFSATGTYKNPDGTTVTTDVTSLATWTSGTTTVASITSTGLATAVGIGTSLITAALDGVTGSTSMIVGGPVAVSLQISPANPTVAIASSETFTAQEMYSDGTSHPLSGAVSWTSGTASTATIATLANVAFARALGTGASTITATEGGLTGNTTLTVAAAKTHFAYVSNNTDSTIQWYSVSTTTGPYLASLGTLTATAPVQTVIHPSGQYLYYIDINSDVWVTTINSSTGALTATTFAAQKGGAGSRDANFMTIDPYGRFLYVSDDGGNTSLFTIYGFKISAVDGSLAPLSGSPFTANLNTPECLIIEPTGTYLYATNEGNSTISAYTIDQNTGALTPLSTPTFPTGSGPFLGGLDPSGTHLYVANTAPTNSISGFSIGADGILTSVGPDTTVSGATDLTNLVVDPSGTHVYVLDTGDGVTNGRVFGFSLGTGGVIGSAISGTPVAAGILPFGGIVIDPTGMLMAVDNNTSDSISLYTIGPKGVLTAVSPVNTGTAPFFVTLYNAP